MSAPHRSGQLPVSKAPVVGILLTVGRKGAVEREVPDQWVVMFVEGFERS